MTLSAEARRGGRDARRSHMLFVGAIVLPAVLKYLQGMERESGRGTKVLTYLMSVDVVEVRGSCWILIARGVILIIALFFCRCYLLILTFTIFISLLFI